MLCSRQLDFTMAIVKKVQQYHPWIQKEQCRFCPGCGTLDSFHPLEDIQGCVGVCPTSLYVFGEKVEWMDGVWFQSCTMSKENPVKTSENRLLVLFPSLCCRSVSRCVSKEAPSSSRTHLTIPNRYSPSQHQGASESRHWDFSTASHLRMNAFTPYPSSWTILYPYNYVDFVMHTHQPSPTRSPDFSTYTTLHTAL